MTFIDIYGAVGGAFIAYLSLGRLSDWREIGVSPFVLAGILWPAYLYVLYADAGFDG